MAGIIILNHAIILTDVCTVVLSYIVHVPVPVLSMKKGRLIKGKYF